MYKVFMTIARIAGHIADYCNSKVEAYFQWREAIAKEEYYKLMEKYY